MRRMGWLLAGVLLLWAGLAFARVPEVPRFRAIGVADGLPATGINAIVRDHAGYIWIATADGLARYDGVGFKVWRNEPGNPQSLPGNTVQALHVDARDRIWIATESGGLSMLDAQRRGFTHYRMAEHPEIGSDDTWAIASKGGVVWFGTYAGGVHRLAADGTITRFMPAADGSAGLPSPTVLAMVVDAKGVLWVGTTRGLARWTGTGFERVPLPGDKPGPLVFSLSLEGDALWVGAGTGVFRRNAAGGWVSPSWSPMFEKPNAMQALVRDSQGQFWIGSQRGLWRVRGDGIPVPVHGEGPGIAKAVAALLLQENGALWAPIPGIGLGYLRPDWRQVAQFSRRDSALTGVLYNGVAPARDGGFWLANYSGAPERIAANGVVERLQDAVAEKFGTAKLSTIAETAEGILWASNRVQLFRIAQGEVRTWNVGDTVDPLLNGLDLMRIAPDGSLWLSCTGSGMQQRDARTGQVLRSWKADTHGLGLADFESLVFAPDGSLWVAGDGGVRVLAPGGDRFVAVPAMGDARVYALALDGGSVWLSRRTGLERYRRDGSSWKLVDVVAQDQGIPAVEAAGMAVDPRHRVWLSTSRGLFRWDPSNQRLRRLGIQEGLGSQEFAAHSIAMAGGVLATTTTDGGVVLVDVNLPDPKLAAPELKIDDIAVRRDGHWQALPPGDMELPPQTRELRVRMHLLDFADPSGNRYASRLHGEDADWLSQGSSGERIFSGLTPGDYTLELRARNAEGETSATQVLRWKVLPPWWRTPWALATFAAVTLLMLWWGAMAWRTRQHEREALRLVERERALAEQASLAKSRFLATLGHEVRTPMTGVLGMGELLLGTGLDAKQQGYVESIRDAGAHLLRLVNDALDLARIEAGRLELDPQPFALRELVEDVAALQGPLARQRGLVFDCQVADGAPAMLEGDPTRIRQILFNLLGNAIKFTQDGEVGLRVEPLGREGVRFVVRDTGPGLSAEQRSRLFRRFEQADGARTTTRYGGSGLGLAISQELAAAMGGRIDVASSPGVGTRFSVELPLKVLPLLPSQLPARVAHVAATDGLRLLLVEDDPTVAEVLRGLLQAQGHRVVHAAHGLAALSELATQPFDVALLDLDLPGMDGLSLAGAMRDRGYTGPLLAVTARADAAAEPEARAAGFDAFLRKPVTGSMLADALDACRSDACAATGDSGSTLSRC